jgi:hypothetical protein
MEVLKNLVPLRAYCKDKEWPRLSQWHHWIYSRNQIAVKCIKKIGNRYMLDLKAFEEYVNKATLDES